MSRSANAKVIFVPMNLFNAGDAQSSFSNSWSQPHLYSPVSTDDCEQLPFSRSFKRRRLRTLLPLPLLTAQIFFLLLCILQSIRNHHYNSYPPECAFLFRSSKSGKYLNTTC